MPSRASLLCRCLAPLLALGAIAAAQAAEPDAAALTPAICQARTSCVVAKVTAAGQSGTGAPLWVALVTLDLADKPDDGPDEGCLSDREGVQYDGGSEYWLIAGDTAPRLVLKLCNTGYGEEGAGGDEVTIGQNRLTRTQMGGRTDRWEQTQVIALEPQMTLGVRDCEYLGSEGGARMLSWTDVPHMAVRVLAQEGSGNPDDPATETDCLKPTEGWVAEPAQGMMAALDIPYADIQAEGEPPAFPDHGTLGSCAAAIASDGQHGFMVYGTPDPGRVAELRFVALDDHTLLVQVYDPRPSTAPARSWVGGDHIELWLDTDSDSDSTALRPDPKQVAQIGIGLDGKVNTGIGRTLPPTVERWEARDNKDRPVTVLKLSWPDEAALQGGVLLAYSEAEAGRQARIVATAGIARNRPVYLPELASVPVRCGPVEGRWDIIDNPGLPIEVEY